MVNFVGDFLDFIDEQTNPKIAREKTETREICQKAELAATAVLVASTALAIFGMAMSITSALGLPILFVTLPLCYLSYNCSKTIANFAKIIDRPTKYQNFIGLDKEINRLKVKEKLLEGTICFDWAVNALVDKYVADEQNRIKLRNEFRLD